MVLLILGLIGAITGSFLIASLWRLRSEQLALNGADSNNFEYRQLVQQHKLNRVASKNDHSRCLHCGYRLRWYDLIPIFSWLLLAGKCRRCRSRIGYMEFGAELGMTVVFILSYLFWPLGFDQWWQLLLFGLWLIWLMLALVLFFYDLKWLELPTVLLHLSIAVALVFALIRIGFDDHSIGALANYLWSISILAGVYWALAYFSKERAVGSGDAYIGLALALLLGDGLLAFLTLFLANLIGLVFYFPSIIKQKRTFGLRLPLGPLLIVAGFIAFFWGRNLIQFIMLF